MAMKYVKLFENWLLTEGDDGKIKVFAPTAPQKTPVLNTTIKDFESLSSDQISTFFQRLFRRAKQTPGSDKFVAKPEDGENLNIELTEEIKLDKEATIGDPYRIGSPSREIIDKGDREDNIETIQEFFKIDKNSATILMQDVISKSVKDDNTLTAKDGVRYLTYDAKFSCTKIVDPKAKSDVYFQSSPRSNTLYGKKTGIIDMGIVWIFVISGGKVVFRKYNGVSVGQLLAFISTNMDPEELDLLEQDGLNKYADICQDIFGGEGETDRAKFAKTMKVEVGDKTLELVNDETPTDKGGKGVEMPIFVGGKVMGSCGFDFGKANLKEDSKKTLSSPELLNILKTAVKTLEIIGHTDGKGDKGFNQKLSEERAKSVLEFLKSLPEFKEIKPSVKITTSGKGSSEMVEDDKGGSLIEIAVKNRRVVILVDDKGPNYDVLYK